MSNEQKSFIKKYKIKKAVIFMWQVFILLFFLILWEVLSKHNIINPFIFSSPSKVVKCIINLYKDNNLFIHIWVTIY